MSLPAGTRLGRYEISSLLGSGGMGDVYQARDSELERDVALKVPPPAVQDDPHLRARFKREARAVAALNHHNIVTIHDFGEADGTLFIAFEFIEGETLEQRLSRGRLSVAQAVTLAMQIADGLAHAHDAGVLHRDLKPRNIMITGEDRLKILDFGLGKFVAAPSIDTVTTTTDLSAGYVLGTVGYMSPEQVRNVNVDASSDQFVFGALLYEMLTGRRAFHRSSAIETMSATIAEEPLSVTSLAPRTPATLVALVSRCLAKHPEQRYATTRELLADLQRINEALADDTRVTEMPWNWRRALVAGAGVVVIAILVAALYFGQASRSPAPPTSAQTMTLALLPIEFAGDDASERAYWNGLTASLSTRLGALPASVPLHVTPASDVAARRVRSAQDARLELGASHIVRGLATSEQGKVSARLDLVDTVSDRVLRTKEITADRGERATLPNRILDAVLSMVEVSVTAAQRTRVTSPDAVAGADDFYLQGLGYLQDDSRPENVDTAVSLFEHAIALDAKHATAYAGLGEAFWRRYLSSHDARWAETARQTCERALGIDEEQSAPHRCLGTVATGVGSYEKAIEEFQHALAREPDNEIARIGLATAYARLGQNDRAEDTFLEAIRLRPRYWSGYSRLGAFYYAQRRYADAERMFQQVLLLNPDSWRNHSNLGALYYVQGRTQDAVASYERSLSIRPNYQAASNLGTLYFYDLRDYTRAAEAFRRAVKLDEDEYVVWGNLASALYWAGQRSEAQVAYRKAAELADARLKVNPREPNVLMSLAEYTAALSQRGQARTLMDTALSLAPKDARLMFQAGVLYEQRFDDRDKALEWLERALEAGYQWKEVERSPALTALRQDARVERLRQRTKTAASGRKGA
jgi:tetratricopeptide (TPR) repeat protein